VSVARHRDLLILGAVHSHSIHGYALAAGLEQGLGKALGLKRPSVYACLKRLEERGLLRHTVKRDSPYPERRVYSVTAKGKKELSRLVHSSAERTVDTMVPLAVVVAFLDLLPEEEQQAVLRQSQVALRAALDQLTSVPAHEGHAGRALELLHRHYELDLEAVEALLASPG
jgi:DNA-binding PadR family transcriptional regulator